MQVDSKSDLNQGRRSVKRFLVRVIFVILGLILFLMAALVTLIESPIAPIFLINRSDQAVERLSISVVYLDSDTGVWSGPEVWSGRLGAGSPDLSTRH